MRKIAFLFLLLASTVGQARHDHDHHRHHDVFVAHQSNAPGFDLISLTLGPGSFIAPFPAGTSILAESALASVLMADFKVRDISDNVIGVGSELEDIDFNTLVAESNWTVVVPGRGTIFGSQKETLAPLFAIVQDMVARGVLEQTFDPPFELVTTIAGSGSIVGGTGEFDGAKGTMVETDRLHFISLITGTLSVDDSVEFVWK